MNFSPLVTLGMPPPAAEMGLPGLSWSWTVILLMNLRKFSDSLSGLGETADSLKEALSSKSFGRLIGVKTMLRALAYP